MKCYHYILTHSYFNCNKVVLFGCLKFIPELYSDINIVMLLWLKDSVLNELPVISCPLSSNYMTKGPMILLPTKSCVGYMQVHLPHRTAWISTFPLDG